jgi:hypothetical protein
VGHSLFAIFFVLFLFRAHFGAVAFGFEADLILDVTKTCL